MVLKTHPTPPATFSPDSLPLSTPATQAKEICHKFMHIFIPEYDQIYAYFYS